MKYSILILFSALFISCISAPDPVEIIDYTEQNEQAILDYIVDNDLVAEKSETGLYYVIDELGTGAQPVLISDVTITYKGYFTSNNVFDESTDNVSFNLQELIPGFAEGVTYLKEGGSGTFLAPSRLAYGTLGNGTIPPGAVVIFDVSLISVD